MFYHFSAQDNTTDETPSQKRARLDHEEAMDYENNLFNMSQYGDEAPLTPPPQNTNDAEGTAKGCAWRLPVQAETGTGASKQPCDVEGTAKGSAWRLPVQPETGTEASGQPCNNNAPLTPPRQPPDDENVPLSQLAAPQPPQPPDDDDDAPLVKPAGAVAAISPP